MQCKSVTALPAAENFTFEIKFDDSMRSRSLKVRSRASRMILGASRREYVVDALRHDRLDLLRDRPAMFDHIVGTHLERRGLRFGAKSRRNDGEPGQ